MINYKGHLFSFDNVDYEVLILKAGELLVSFCILTLSCHAVFFGFCSITRDFAQVLNLLINNAIVPLTYCATRLKESGSFEYRWRFPFLCAPKNLNLKLSGADSNYPLNNFVV